MSNLDLNMPLDLLLQQLPKHAEEGRDNYSVCRSDLYREMVEGTQLSSDVISATLDMVERLLDTISVFDRSALEAGEWRFTSFPAQLMATSILTAIADRDSRYCPDNFWDTNNITNPHKNRLRDLLHDVEDARFKNHADKMADPIRFIYVAWSLIKLNGKFLFHLREDTKKRYNTKSGDYGLVGGRINQSDLSDISDLNDKLSLLQSGAMTKDAQYFKNALKREIKEEIGLEYDIHYKFHPFKSLVPYEQVEGAAPNHALTRYFFRLFTIDLTLDGYLELNKHLQSIEHEELIWCTADQMMEQNCNGNRLYIQALHDHYQGGSETLRTELDQVGDSFTSSFKIPKNTPSDAVIIPSLPKRDIQVALHGAKHLSSYETMTSFSDDDIDLLLGLAAHMRGFTFDSITKGLFFLPHGWIDAGENEKLLCNLLDLANRLPDMFEKHRDQYLRISVDPEILFFDNQLFEFKVNDDELNNFKDKSKKTSITLNRLPFDTMLGHVSGDCQIGETTKERIRFFVACHERGGISFNEKKPTDDDNAKSFDNLQKWMGKLSKKIGLRKAIGQNGSQYQVNIKGKK